ncbi:MAG: HD domain-containing protein [Thermonemataceae bacterium]|nr:HD domain-containing protein [Thermonemataceae bacterium]
MKKGKILNDPVHGFINIPNGIIFELIEHPYFQRLRRIRQLGLADFVYPGALHTRFHHAIGVMHLMGVALDTIQYKGHSVSTEEREAAQIAALLHDIGHSPLSHSLENTILQGIAHEKLSLWIMQKLNAQFSGALDLAIKIFTNQYAKKYLHQLVSSQLDVDRLDYLQRDCFFTGVSEGAIGGDRILKMLNVVDNNLVVEEKGIYSVENFLTARRLMYWQVYLHKTAISAEKMVMQVMRRAKFLVQQGEQVFASPSLAVFMKKQVSLDEFLGDDAYLEHFVQLDDHDIWGAIKLWQNHRDKILAILSQKLLQRKLFKILMSSEKIEEKLIKTTQKQVIRHFDLEKQEADYFVVADSTKNMAYQEKTNPILIQTKNKAVLDISEASDLPNIKALRKIVKKYYLCYPQM